MAQFASVLLAAMLGSAAPGGYRVRACAFLGALLWSIAGTIVLFARTGGAAPTQGPAVSAARVGLWIVSSWLWPVLLIWPEDGDRSKE